MRRITHHTSATIAWLGLALAWLAVASSSALGIAAPSLSVTPASPSQATDWTFTFSAAPDPGATIIGYEGGLVGSAGETPVAPVASPRLQAGVPEGVHYFRVRAVQIDGLLAVSRSAYATQAIRADRTPPAPPTTTLPPPNGTNGWYRSLTVRWTCSDPSGASCPDQVITRAERGARARQTATDGAGNVSAEGVSAAFNFDNGTVTPYIASPSNNARVAGEPTFTWTRVVDPTSGGDRTEVYARWSGTSDQLIASAVYPIVSTQRNVRPAPLPEGVAIRWYVKFFDKAGNSLVSSSRVLTIDPTPPSSAPAITSGPAGPTRDSTPSFGWSGDQPAFEWDVTRAGEAAPLQSGQGAATQVTLAALTDGDYTFRVSQVTSLGAVGPETSRIFSVDTAPPAPPVITARPPVPTSGAIFAWATEAGAFSRWGVVTAAGAPVRGPSDSVATSVNLTGLASGDYAFRVAQVDAAGNVSASTTEAFTVLLAPGTAATSPRKATPLPRRNAKRLTPRAGRRLNTLRPLLRWKRGPRGTTLYNLQVFRVVRRENAATPSIVKVVSVFPKRTVYRLPRKKMRPGQCYVWRIWPYARASFTKQPLGISNFCVASAKALLANNKRVAKVKAKARAKARAALR